LHTRESSIISSSQSINLVSHNDDDDDDNNNNNNNNNLALQTKYYATNILNTGTDNKCRLCQQFDETIEHTISACRILAKEQYIKRHDRVCAQLHFNICKETGIKLDKKHWYEHVPKSIETSQGGKVTILWNQQVQTDRTIPNNKQTS
jgi:hypothetical protein